MTHIEANPNCDLYYNERCRKSASNRKCDKCRSNESWFDEEFHRCNIDEVCRRDSIFGNSYFKLTTDDIDALKRGEILYYVSEYGTFIMLEQSNAE